MKASVTEEQLACKTPPARVVAIIGNRFNRFVVLKYAGRTKSGNDYIHCRCDCGTLKMVAVDHLKHGKTKSCGCYRDEHPPRLKHGYAPLRGKRRKSYVTWQGMKKRCFNPKNKHYKYYGGRGIGICERWLGPDGFNNFLNDMGEPKPGMSIDRIDNNIGYCQSNCRWIPHGDQAKNRRHNWNVILNGERMTAVEATRRLGYNKTAFDKSRNKWLAQVKGRYVGRFNTKEEAVGATNRL